ncbi:MAG: hypothetical protein HOB79_02100 [Rhodospirillaceae bacterium]|nr:hypothetical protein [Rhodospirillales bacterium]MBT3904353.1 hypothetical protein [Rhodospirillaceae bacterium]MBT4699842.1 hypothetical protein [Rhodospirillaceae bacterium]MBT5032984.1 hypothetical protein [Rhodospirillaceae bacterium]MBT6220194.1 hypothetical protein [Rhodospirillaceae bacterium]
MAIDRRAESRGSDRRDTPRYDLGGVFATLNADDEKFEVVDIGDVNVSVEIQNSALQVNDKIKISVHVPLIGKMATLPITGTVSRVAPESVIVSYDVPSITWPKLLSVLAEIEQN